MHDGDILIPRFASHADHVVHMFDGRIVENQVGPGMRPPKTLSR